MSVQQLLNLALPRSGQVDSTACVQCAALRKQMRTAVKSNNADGVDIAHKAMRLHKDYGHPDDTRTLPFDLPKNSPRLI